MHFSQYIDNSVKNHYNNNVIRFDFVPPMGNKV